MASTDVGTIRLGLEANTSGFQRDIQNILNSTEGSVRSRAVRLGNIYRQQGMSQSSAMRRTWSDVRRNVSTSCSGMTRSTETATSKISSAFSGLASKIAAAFSIAVVTAFTKKCIEAAASVNALNSQFEQTFGSMQAQAKQAMQTVAKNSGIVQSRLQGVGTSIYAFAKTTGMDSVTALNMMQEALQITADSAAYYDRSLEDTAESLKSFLKGNFENDAALGLSCTETTRNAMANKLYGKSFIELSESQKQLALLQMVKEANQLSGAMGQASRESDGWENVTGNLKESWKQLLAVIGQPVLKVATQAVKALTEKLQTLTEYAKHAGNAIREVFGWKNDEVSEAISSVASNADSATKSIEETTKANERLKNSLSGFDKLNVLKKENESDSSDTSDTTVPSQTANMTIAPIDTSSVEGSFEKVTKKIKALLKPLKELIDKINWKKIKKAFSDLKKSLEPFEEKVGEGLKWLWDNALEPIADWTGGVIVSVLEGIANAFNWISQNETAVDILSGVLTALITFGSITLNPFGFLVIIALIKKGWQEVSVIIKEKWQETCDFIEKATEPVREFFGKAREWFVTNVVQPIIKVFTPVKDKMGEIFAKLWEIVTVLWGVATDWFNNKVIQPILQKFTSFKDSIKKKFSEAWTSIKETFKPATTFFTDLWNKIKQKFTAIGTIVGDAFSSAIKTVINSILTGVENKVNFFVDAINGAIDLINTIPGVSISKLTRLEIPKLAKGGVVKAPTLALVGDNAGANTGNPEVVAPLNKLKGMLNESDGSAEDTVILSQILQYLIKIYEAISSDGSTNIIELIAKLDESVVFKRMIELNKQYKKRHNGKSAFA